MLEVATKDDLTAIYAQLGELKYKVEKLEGCTKPCTCSCTKPEQPALEWEVWNVEWPGSAPTFACPSEGNAKLLCKWANKEWNFKYEVRHNPKRK